MDLKALGFPLLFLFFWLACSDEGTDTSVSAVALVLKHDA
jgi:hypothetical protein